MATQPAKDMDKDQALNGWCPKIPSTGGGSPLSRKQITEFYQMCHRLIQLHDAAITHRVITELASEGGLTRIAELVKLTELSLTPSEKKQLFETIILPFLEVMTHKDVLYSMILEQVVANIYVFLYGINGRRATALLDFLAGILRVQLDSSLTEALYSWTLTILAALLQILECNQTASLLERFRHIVDTLQACLDALSTTFQGTLMEQAASHQMAKVRRHLDYGVGFAPLQSTTPTVPNLAAAFEIAQDGPGALSSLGSRHDNDHSQIRDIKILPTSQEIHSLRTEYLPTKDPSRWHLPGIHGLLDQQFRLLREDTVGQLRDCVRTVMESLKPLETRELTEIDHEIGLRIHKYSKVVLSGVNFDRKARLRVMAQFQQPEHLSRLSAANRRLWWDTRKQLQLDALVCLVDSDGHCLFFSVCDRKGFSQAGQPIAMGSRGDDRLLQGQEEETKVPNLWHSSKRGAVTLRLIDMGNQDFKQMLGRDLQASNVEQVIVEYPGVLLPSFQPTLEALQHMSKHVEVPFSDMLLPNQESGPVQTSWPAYATQPQFAFDLSPIVAEGEPLYVQQNEAFDFNSLKERSTLDDAQCKALVGALSRNLALVQGPPGTGKSYITVQAVKVLLECREKAEMKPIICVCYTNHALDQFLEHLVEGGTKQIVRIGSKSKSAILKPFNLREITAKMERTKTEKGKVYTFRLKLEKEGKQVVDLFQKLKYVSTLGGVLQYLEVENQSHHDQLKGTEDTDGFQIVQRQRGDRLKQWLEATTAPCFAGQQPRSVEELTEIDLTHMSNNERRLLYEHWVSDSRQDLTEQFDQAISRYVKTEKNLQKCIQEVDLRCLEEAYVIGVTTSGLARNVELLRRLKPKVLICEEAGEILEAHTLTAFLPSIEHAILIGDHDQLRPGVQNYDLSLENPRGEKYSLDVSTFERLITNPDLEIPHETLQTQRRMDPSISDLIRKALYPALKDHDSVLAYPPVTGVRNRLYWLDHREPETGEDPTQALQNSHSNMYEVDLVQALATHFVRQGVYDSNEIVLLTPYVRQLLMLREMLSNTFEIIIGDKDQDELAKEGLDASDVGPVAKHRVMLKQRMRISTVDNFQGEESKIVIISLVRSNQEKRCGFLRTTNRINVLLSRAKHGMFIFGNSETYNHIPMWFKVIKQLRDAGNMGPSLPLCCPQHPDTSIDVSTPEDFLRKAPEGGCDLQCGLKLDCGHLCTYKCHTKARHQSVICHEPCERVHDDCGHLCTRPCGVDCSDCVALVEDVDLNCGHTASGVPCHQMMDLASVECQFYIEYPSPGCGHKAFVKCGQEIPSTSNKCEALCGADLACRHQCRKPCGVCRLKGIRINNHGSCNALCGRSRSTCVHLCAAVCHGDSLCPPCDLPCSISCSHSTCTKRCCESCAPCAQPCTVGCAHQGYCHMPCAVPCEILPCSLRCEEALACGHQCPSVCGESCPGTEFCHQCASITIKQTPVDFGSLIEIGTLKYEEIDPDETPILVPTCGHIILVTTMDRLLGMSAYYEISDSGLPVAFRSESFPLSIHEAKGCPQCQGSLRDLNRYNRLIKRPTLDESTKKFIIRSNSILVSLATRLQQEEERLSKTQSTMSAAPKVITSKSNHVFPTLVRLGGPRGVLFHNIGELSGLESRCGPLLALHDEILTFLGRVREDEQPFAEIQWIVNQRPQAMYRAATLKTTSGLLTKALLLRCEYDILSEIIKMHREHNPEMATQHRWLTVKLRLDLDFTRRDCHDLINEAIQKSQPITEVESRLLFAKFVGLERLASIDPDGIEELLPQARRQMEIVKYLAKDSSVLGQPSLPALGTENLVLEKELQKHFIREGTLNVRCKVLDCTKLFAGANFWRKHVEKRHPQWYQKMKTSMSSSAISMLAESVEVEKNLQDCTAPTVFISMETEAMYLEMAQDLEGAGEWFYCVNMHAFTKGKHEAPMDPLRCPQCGEHVAGPSQQAEEDVQSAVDLEHQSRDVVLSAQCDLLEIM